MLPETHGPGADHQHAVTLAVEAVATVQVARSLLLQDFEDLLVLERQNILKILGKNWHIVFEILKKKYRNLNISTSAPLSKLLMCKIVVKMFENSHG